MKAQRNPRTKAGSASAGPWSADERAAVIGLYLAMRGEIADDRPLNKAAMIRMARGETEPVGWVSLHGTLSARSRGSIEAKMMNISAALEAYAAEAAHPAELCGVAHRLSMATHGYKSLPNMQADLRRDVWRMVEIGPTIAAELDAK